jgi:predicted nuclease of restriction endonuclease-like RecB superfamily
MLTADLVRSRLRQYAGELKIDWLEHTPEWLETAAELVALFREQLGRTQEEWELNLAEYEGHRTDYIIIRGLAKVLTDAADFSAEQTPITPSELRLRIFAEGPVLDEPNSLYQTRQSRLEQVAGEYELGENQLEYMLYADRPAKYRLVDVGPEWSAADLIARYNLELARAALYYADELKIEVYDTFKHFWQYLKLFKLMFWATTNDQGGYSVQLDGPISPFVQSTTRYGRQFAAFLPALFLCNRWTMAATVQPPQFGRTLTYKLSNAVPLTSHFKSKTFDSKLEANFAAEFHEKFGDERGKWLLTREDEVLLLGDTVMIPDFALTHKEDSRRALIEIMGYWHEDYLRRKIAKVREAKRHDLLLLVYEGVNLRPEKLTDIPAEVLYFKKKPVLKDVIAAVERIAKPPHK